MNKENQIQQIADEAIKKIQAIRDAREEKENRAGEWVPRYGAEYYYVMSDGEIGCFKFKSDVHDQQYTKTGNLYPTKPIAEAAKAHADWWRDFDMSDEGGSCEIFAHAGSVSFGDSLAMYGNPKFKTEDNARVAIGRLGGEQKVIEMLNAGRVFRFKWGGQ